MEYTQTAVSVRDAYKWYSNVNILNGLNMTVPHGTIYALLGPSGCGKTTLLRSILGRVDLDEGSIQTSVSKRIDVGYMPQELALQEDISVDETLLYYGRIYEMGKEAIMDAKLYLFPLLNLSLNDTLVKNLSGGQKRRLSFAIALLHDPQLLILDEPTVGVDPILRSTLWEHLNKISSCGKTIIITTHYIEEACQAHVVGLMRGGVLLAENSPMQILRERNFNRLEDAFVDLCCDQQIEFTKRPSKIKVHQEKKKQHIKENKGWNLTRFWGQLLKNFVWFKRNLAVVFYLLMLPVILNFLVNIIFQSRPKGLKVGIVTDEISFEMTECNPVSEGQNKFDSCFIGAEPLSCVYKDFISRRNIVIPRQYSSLELAKSSVVPDRLWGVVYIKGNFTDSLLERVNSGRFSSDETIERSTVDVWLDMSDAWVSTELKIHIRNSFQDLVKAILRSCNYTDHHAEIPPIRMNEAIFGSNQPNFLHHALPGVLIPFVFYLTLMFTMGAIMMEKKEGTLDRCLSAGLTFKEVVVAHIISQTVIIWAQIAVCLVISYLIYDNPIKGNFLIMIFIIVLIEAIGTAFGFFLALIYDNENLATYNAVGVVVGLFMLEGVIWPFEGMHVILRKILWAVPLIPSIISYECVAQKGWAIDHPVVLYGLLQTTAWTLIFSILSYITFKIRKIGNSNN